MANPTARHLAQQLAEIDTAVTDAITRTLTQAAERMEADARAMIGTEPDIWPALATATIAEKARLGFSGQISPTDPLLRTGDLRESITAQADADGITLGSSSPIATYQERGTARIPPRPFLATTMRAHVDEITHSHAGTVAETIRAALQRR